MTVVHLLLFSLFLQQDIINCSCGEKSVFSTATALGVDCTISSVHKEYRELGFGDTCSLSDLTRLLHEFELQSCLVEITSKDVRNLPVGSIVHINHANGHFATYLGVEDKGVVLANAPMPLMRLPFEDFKKVWSGKAVAVFRRVPLVN